MTDGQLLEAFIRQRDEAAFAELLRLHGPMVLGVCQRVLGNYHDAEEAFQAVFLVLSQKAAAIWPRNRVGNWLYGVAYRTALKARSLRERRRTKEGQNVNAPEPVVNPPPPWTELAPLLDCELNALPEKYRLPVVLCEIEGRSHKDVAHELGCPEATISGRLMRARDLLQRRLARHGIVLSAGALAVLITQNATSAAIPVSLIATTLSTANLLSVGTVLPTSMASSKAAVLAKGVTQAMFFAKVKLLAALLIVVTATGLGIHAIDQQPSEQAQNRPGKIAANQTVELPAHIREALEENARSLSPISISYTEEFRTTLPLEETYKRLGMANANYKGLLFQKTSQRVIWDDRKFYTYWKGVSGGTTADGKYEEVLSQTEISFDGRVLYQGFLDGDPDANQNLTGTLNIELAAKAPNLPQTYFSPEYFQNRMHSHSTVGVSFPPGPNRTAEMEPESTVLGLLQRGGELISVSDILLDDRTLVKIEIIADNFAKIHADQMDLEQVKQRFTNPPTSDEEEELMVENYRKMRRLPAKKRHVFYLDPEFHYAQRLYEEWYDPQTLLVRCRCDEFEQLSDRPLWLPRKYVIEHYSFHMVPGTFFEKLFLTTEVNITELAGEKIPDHRFAINYTTPGITVNDNTQENSEEIAYQTGRTPAETERNRAVAQSTDVQPPFTPLTWFLLANVVIFLMVGGYFAYLKIRR